MELRQIEHSSVARIIALATAGGALAVSLTGCVMGIDNDRPSTVVSHEYQEGHWLSAKPAIYDDEDYVLNLEQCGYDPEEVLVPADGCISHSLEVSPETYDLVQDGDKITFVGRSNPTVTVVPQ